MPGEHTIEPAFLNDAAPAYRVATDGDIDLSLLKDSLSMTPWQRMQANDDAVNFADSLRNATLARHAKP